MAFRITAEMVRMREAELGFSEEVRRAQFREMSAIMRWELYKPLREARQALYRPFRGAIPGRPDISLPPDKEEVFQPSEPNFLYVLAREAYNGEYRSYELFMLYLGFPIVEVDEKGRAPGATEWAITNTGYVLDATHEVLRITFEPRGHHRRKWEQEPSHDAREWLRRRLRRELRERARKGSLRRVPSMYGEPRIKLRDPHQFYDRELYDLLFKKAVEDTDLTKRQAEIVWLFAEFYNPDHPSATTKAIAKHLNVSPQAVRKIRYKARGNEDLRRLLGLP